MDNNDRVEMIKSNKGGAKIIYKGYMYTIHKRVQDRIRWRCSQRTLYCKGSVTTGHGPPVINRPHNHIPDANALAKARSRSALLQNEASPQGCPVDIIPLGDSQLGILISVPLSREMENWQIRRTTRGIRLIDAKGYTYTKDRHVGNKSYWRCDYRPWKCKARASLVGTANLGDCNKGDVMFNMMSHGHGPTLQSKSKGDDENDMEDHLIETPPQKSLLKPQPKSASLEKSSLPISQPPPSPESEMCLRWNSHHVNMQTIIPMLMDDERYVDVTLAAEGKLLKCHKLILSSCSTYFDEMLKGTNSLQQVIIFLRDVKFWQIKALVDFMYKGEVNVDQSKLEALLQAAEDLQIKGLAGKTPKKEQETIAPLIESHPIMQNEPNYSDNEIKTEMSNSTLEDDGDEDYFPHSEYKKGKYKKNKKRKISNPPDPSLLKQVKINLKGTKSRPNIKQPKFFSPDYPEYNPDSCISPPKPETDSVYRIDNIKLEPIDIEVPQSPTFLEMSSMMDKSISESSSNKDSQINIEEKSTIYNQASKDHEEKSKTIFETTCKTIEIPSTSKEILPEKIVEESLKTDLETISLAKKAKKDVLNLNKNTIIVKRQNVHKFIEDTKLQKILDAVTTKTLNDSDKLKLPQIRVRNLPTTETMLKKFATTQLTSILKKGDSPTPPNKHIILKKVGNKPAILRHSLPTKTKTFTTENQNTNNDEIAEKISLLAKTKKELNLTDEKKESVNIGESSKKIDSQNEGDEEIIAD